MRTRRGCRRSSRKRRRWDEADFALCLVLALLAGCAPAPNAPSSGAPASSQTVQEPPAPTFAVGVLDTVQWSGYGTGSNGGDAYYELAVLAENAAGPDGLTRRVSMLLRTDYATLTQAPLCSVPGCGHSDAACPAYIEGNNVAVAAIGGNVYLMGSVYGTWFVQNAASSAPRLISTWWTLPAPGAKG